MFYAKILLEEWTAYNERKAREGSDALQFDCRAAWETEFLVKKIRQVYSHHMEDDIRNAVDMCCKHATGPRPRKDFLACVMMRLRGL